LDELARSFDPKNHESLSLALWSLVDASLRHKGMLQGISHAEWVNRAPVARVMGAEIRCGRSPSTLKLGLHQHGFILIPSSRK
jgi:hypothetical protein